MKPLSAGHTSRLLGRVSGGEKKGKAFCRSWRSERLFFQLERTLSYLMRTTGVNLFTCASFGEQIFYVRMARSVSRLLQDVPLHCAVLNKHAQPQASTFMKTTACKRLDECPLECFVPPGGTSKIPPSPQTREGLLYYYVMNPSSVCSVLALDLQPDDCVLDLCAAPGGKSFAILQQISLRGGLALNEPSSSRMARLKRVIRSCVPADMQRSIRFTQRKGEEWGNIERNEYDKVLVDAPCSSDRDCIQTWTKRDQMWPHSTKLAALQLELVSAGLLALKPGGTLVYSTCTMSEVENDGVFEAALKRTEKGTVPGFQYETAEEDWSGFEEVCRFQKTEFGVLVVPEEGKNSGPAYIAKCRKL